MSAKTHFYESFGPLPENQDYGKLVKNARFSGMAVVGAEWIEIEGTSTILFCPWCLRCAIQPALGFSPSIRFLYSLVDGESLKQAERGREQK